jgi:hypothetical protein
MLCGIPAAYFCIEAFSETDMTEDLKKFGVPTSFFIATTIKLRNCRLWNAVRQADPLRFGPMSCFSL